MVMKVPVMFPQNSSKVCPFFLIVGLVVILCEKSCTWRMLDRHEFLLLQGFKDLTWFRVRVLKGFKEGEGNRVLVKERGMDGWVMGRESVEGFNGEHEWPKNRGSLWEILFKPFLKRENVLHVAHRYTRYDINYRLGVMTKKFQFPTFL